MGMYTHIAHAQEMCTAMRLHVQQTTTRARVWLRREDFLSPMPSVSIAEGASLGTREETESPPPPKRNTHRQSFDPKWQDEVPWVEYNPSDKSSGKPSMLCRLCCKHNKMSRRIVYIFLASFYIKISYTSMSTPSATIDREGGTTMTLGRQRV